VKHIGMAPIKILKVYDFSKPLRLLVFTQQQNETSQWLESLTIPLWKLKISHIF